MRNDKPRRDDHDHDHQNAAAIQAKVDQASDQVKRRQAEIEEKAKEFREGIRRGFRRIRL